MQSIERFVDCFQEAGQYYQVSENGVIRCKQDIVYTNSSRWAKKGDIKYCKGDIVDVKDSHPALIYKIISLYLPNIRTVDNRFCNIYLHRLIWYSFNNQYDMFNDPGYVIDHIDANKINNSIYSLQRLTVNQNMQKSYDNNESGRKYSRNSGVTCIELNKSWDTLKDACIELGISDSRIIGSIRRNSTAGGYHFKYTDDRKDSSIMKTKNTASNNHLHGNTNMSNLVRCVETGEIDKVSVLARKYGLKCSEPIYNAIDFHDGYSKYLGLTFQLL